MICLQYCDIEDGLFTPQSSYASHGRPHWNSLHHTPIYWVEQTHHEHLSAQHLELNEESASDSESLNLPHNVCHIIDSLSWGVFGILVNMVLIPQHIGELISHKLLEF
jgi:hypothetical protein